MATSPSPAFGADKAYFQTLSGLRGVAVLMIVGYHISGYFSAVIAPLAASGVDLFFLVSGVVIETAYGPKLRNGQTPAVFIFARAVRLYPLYALSIAAMLLTIALAPGQGYFLNASSFQVPTPNFSLLALASFFGVPMFDTINMYPLNQPAWSLFFEVIANMVYVLMFPRLTKKLLVCIVTVSFLALVYNTLYPVDDGRVFNGLARVGFSFFLGVLLCRSKLPALPRKLPAGAVVALCAMLLLLHPQGGEYLVLYPALVALGFPAVVYLALQVQPSRRWQPLYQQLGDTSYALYLLHTPLFILFFSVLVPRFGIQLGMFGGAARFVFVGGLLALAWALNRYFDVPVRRFLTGLKTRKTPAAPDPATIAS